jgi:hypothetical protein
MPLLRSSCRVSGVSDPYKFVGRRSVEGDTIAFTKETR